jgi:hypothetical protein
MQPNALLIWQNFIICKKWALQMTTANKWYSYPRVAVIWIDVHPTGENLTNTSHASHAQYTSGPRPYVSHVVNA